MISVKKIQKRKESKRIAAEMMISNISEKNNRVRNVLPFFKFSKQDSYPHKQFPDIKTINRKLPQPGRKINAIFRSCFRASATVEAALVTPLFVFALTVLISVITVTGVQMRVREAVYESVRNASSIPYSLGRDAERTNAAFTKTAALAAVKSFFMQEMRDHPGASGIIEGGAGGVVLTADLFNSEAAAISITAKYNARLPLAFFAGGKIPVRQEIETYAWLGDEFTDSTISEKMVYITPHGRVYHEDINCTYLKPTVYSESFANVGSLRNAGGEKYRECEACAKRLAVTPAAVYITRYGNRYHTNPNCVKIRHEVITVPLSSVRDRHKCLKEQ